MRRALVAMLVCAGGFGALMTVIATTGASGGGSYTVAAVFDTANRVVEGARVKIAGAAVGQVERVELAPGPKARIVMELPRRFAPFRTDARCSILPEGIIAESFVACEPGTATAPLRPTAPGGDPTVPLSQTTIPLSLQQFLNVFTASTSDRVRLLFTELGIATAGRGEDINALLRRSNPALAQARRMLGILDRQRDQLAHGVAQTNRVLASLAARRGAMRRFVSRAAAASRAPAAHSRPLAESFRRFPPLLRALRPSLRGLDRAAVQGTPALVGLRSAAPAMVQLAETLPGFLSAGSRALPSLARAARAGRKAERDAAPFVSHVRQAATELVPFAERANPFFISLRDRGGLEGFLRSWYGLAETNSAYDQTSHMATALVRPFPQCMQDPPAEACSLRYDAPGQGKIPPDDPSCGPQDPAPWNPPTNCVAQAASSASPGRDEAARGERRSEKRGLGRDSIGRAPGGDDARGLEDLLDPPAGDLTPRELRKALEGGSSPLRAGGDAVRDLLDFMFGP